MGTILSSPEQPARGDDPLWARLEGVIEAQVKRDGRLPESAPGFIAQRMKVDALRWLDRVQDSSGETQTALLELFAAALVDRVDAEMEFERERMRMRMA
jgi:hypothetical protein